MTSKYPFGPPVKLTGKVSKRDAEILKRRRQAKLEVDIETAKRIEERRAEAAAEAQKSRRPN